jgi:hypothetical protein
VRLEPIAYQYEADRHCPACAETRFGRGPHGFIAEQSVDFEGNPVGVIAPWDEWADPDWEQPAVLACGTCHGIIATMDLTP